MSEEPKEMPPMTVFRIGPDIPKSRPRLELTMTIPEMLDALMEGNIGAATVVGELVNRDPDDALILLLHCDDMNVRGSQLWVAYKDYADKNVDKLIAAVRARDPEMIEIINSRCASSGQVAVAHSASSRGW